MATLPRLRAEITLDSATFVRETNKVIDSVNRMSGQITRHNAQTQKSFSQITGSLSALKAGLAGLGVGRFVQGIVQAATASERINNTLKAGTGSAQAAGRAYQFVRDEAQRLGLNLEVAADQFGKLSAAARGTALQGQGTRDIFTAVAEAATVLGLSAEQTGGALTAIQQIISKGTVSAEELRGQLGERLPGAFQIAARAIGVTTQELDRMLRAGELTATQLLPALAAELQKTFGPDVAQAAGGLQASLNRLSTAFFDLKVQIAQGGVAAAIADLATSLSSAAQGGGDFADRVGSDLGGAIRAVGGAALIAAGHLREISAIIGAVIAYKAAAFFLALAGAIGGAARAMVTLNVAMLRNPLTLIPGLIALAVAALIEYRDATIQVGDRTVTVGNLALEIWNKIRAGLEGLLPVLSKIGELVGAVMASVGVSVAQAAQPFDALSAKLSVVQDQLSQMRELSASLVSAGVTPDIQITDEIAKLEAEQQKLVTQLEEAQLAQQHFAATTEEANAATAEASTVNAELAKRIASLRGELEQQADQQGRLNSVLGGTANVAIDVFASLDAQRKALETLNDELEVENAITRGNITLQQARAAGLDVVAESLQNAKSENEQLNKALQERISLADETEQIQLLLRFAGEETTEYQKQLVLLRLKQATSGEIAAQAEGEAAAWAAVTQELQQVNAARDLSDTIAEQQLLLRFAGEETEEYRIQLRMLQLKRELGGAITPELEKQVRTLEKQTTVLNRLEEAREKQKRIKEEQEKFLTEPFENALQSIQSSTTQTFETIYSGGVTTFSELAGEVKRIFVRLAAELTSLFIFRNIVGAGGFSFGAVGAAGAAPSLASSLAGTAAASAPLIGAHGMLTGGQAQSVVTPQIAGWQQGLVGGPGALGPAGAPWLLRPNTSPLGLLAAGGLGFFGGQQLGGLFGGAGGTAGGIGGGLGAAAGLAFGGPLGALVGGLGGSLLGGFAGSFFGGGDTGNESGISGGALGTLSGGGLPAQFARDFDKKLIELLDDRQRAIADRMLKNAAGVSVKFQEELSAGDQSRLAAGRLRPIAQGLGFRASAIAGGGRTPEEQLAKLVEALNVQQQVKDLTSGFGAFAQQARALRRQFDELTASAKEFGISRSGLAKAQKEAGFDLIRQQLVQLGGVVPTFRDQWKALKGEFDDVSRAAKQFGFSLSEVNKAEQEAIAVLKERRRLEKASAKAQIAALTGNRFENELAQLNQQFAEGYRLAKQYGLSTRELAQAQKDATTALKAQQRAQTDALALSVVDPFQRLADPLKAFQQQLSFENLNPAGQIAAAEADFQRIANLALAGSTTALQQLQGAGQLFIEQAGRFGASPAQVAAREQVASVIESVLADLDRAQREASRGIEDEIRSASRRQVDTLKEIVAEVREVASEIKKLRRT